MKALESVSVAHVFSAMCPTMRAVMVRRPSVHPSRTDWLALRAWIIPTVLTRLSDSVRQACVNDVIRKPMLGVIPTPPFASLLLMDSIVSAVSVITTVQTLSKRNASTRYVPTAIQMIMLVVGWSGRYVIHKAMRMSV